MSWRKHIHLVALCLPDSCSKWNLETMVLRKGEEWSTQRKPLRAKERTSKKLSHAFASMPGFERGPNWCIGGKCPYHCAKKRQMLHCNRIIYTGIYDWLNEQDAVDL